MATLRKSEEREWAIHGVNPISTTLEEITIQRNKYVDDLIMGEITKIIEENCIETTITLNTVAIAKAIERATPKPPHNDGWLYCPVCGKDICVDRPNYCSECGQRIDWRTNGTSH